MFDRPHHQRIARVLGSLNGPLLAANACYFGGGTAVALRYGEFRESVDIDFLVSDLAGYRALRPLLTGSANLAAITSEPGNFTVSREVRADQYGIRAMLEVEGCAVKLEVVYEARVPLARPGPDDVICGLATLCSLDMLTMKLLANSDRWGDDGTFSRDLIDLAMMRPPPELLRAAIVKASAAYGPSIQADLTKAAARLREREGRLARCLSMMSMTATPGEVQARIDALSPA